MANVRNSNLRHVLAVTCVLACGLAIAQPPIIAKQDAQESETQQASEASPKLLESGTYFVNQTWSQETNFRRPYHVRIPIVMEREKYPVFIFLHGNGGNAREVLPRFMRHRKNIASRYIVVFAQGYKESWNVVSESSKADDRSFIEEIVLQLADFDNVDSNNFSIMGTSNGAAMVNQLAIESKLPNIRNYVTGVSQLSALQHDGKNFKAKGDGNDYLDIATPMTGKRLMNISGTRDPIVPYRGGPSRAIPGKTGKLAFVDAEESTFLWARQMGYTGERLAKATKLRGNLQIFSYLDGDVIHCKILFEGHGAADEISERIILDFLEGGDVDRERQ